MAYADTLMSVDIEAKAINTAIGQNSNSFTTERRKCDFFTAL